MKGYRYCGSHRLVEDQSFFNKAVNSVRGTGSQNLPEIDIIFEEGIKRTAIPHMYNDKLDFSEAPPKAKIKFHFLDNHEEKVVRFRLYQLTDPNMLYRIYGNNIPYTLDLREDPDLYDHYHIQHKDFIPEEVWTRLKEEVKFGNFDRYFAPFLYNYEKLFNIANMRWLLIKKYESRIHSLENHVSLLTQLLDPNNLGDVVNRLEIKTEIEKRSAHDILTGLRE